MTKTRAILSLAAAALVTCTFTGLAHAASDTISAVIPWQGQGQIFPVGAKKLRFMGSFEGIMYVETAKGEMNEAFVRCPFVQDVDASDGSTSASGSCLIVASAEDSAFAEITCNGVRGLCSGEIELTSGTGRFAGISGSGKITVRSPVHALAANLSEGTVVQAAAGILQIPKLTYKLP